MQKVAAYLLERRDNLSWPEARKAEGHRIREAIAAWLRSKGASGEEGSGTYAAEDGSNATYRIETAEDGDRSWTMHRLDEVSPDGRVFSASLSVTIGAAGLATYVTLEVGSVATQVSPVAADPRCPKVVRDLLLLEGRWYHGASQLHGLRNVTGFDDGEGLAAEVADPARTIPIVVVSAPQQSPTLPRLDERLAYDLAGIANVVSVDDDASWALTDNLGKPLSCYQGAVRVYWPGLRLADDPFRHPLWTAARLTSAGLDAVETRERFRRQLRTLVMRAAALSVVRPRDIDDIRAASAKAVFAELKHRAQSTGAVQELADLYAEDNDVLRSEQAKLEEEVSGLKARVAEMEVERATLLARLQGAEVRNRYGQAASDDIEPAGVEDDGDEPGDPGRGEVRFYKKKYSSKKHDVLVRVQDCGHTSWQGAAGADKAKKGVAKLEGGRSDWRNIQHCGSCEGGGMWRVRW